MTDKVSPYTSQSMGGATSHAVSFYGVTPVTQRASSDQATSLLPATQATSVTSVNWSQINAIRNAVVELQTALIALGAIKGSA